ncbi:hypothetical protein XELAEV_18044421mg [Xenopus laevis]|uniref:Uncharacterized protein n=1 Tax=Xenopus laevis TaxID=8355 RepID=A0A974BYR6_XENLA|nr:hypothetical protein XELAEV_18044421mg [Xenopus laevis]
MQLCAVLPSVVLSLGSSTGFITKTAGDPCWSRTATTRGTKGLEHTVLIAFSATFLVELSTIELSAFTAIFTLPPLLPTFHHFCSFFPLPLSPLPATSLWPLALADGLAHSSGLLQGLSPGMQILDSSLPTL